MKKIIVTYLAISFLLVTCINSNENQYAAVWTEDDKAYLIAHLEESFNSVMDLIQDVDEQQWNWQPDSNVWSVALVVEHLIVHDELFYREVNVLTALPEMTALGVDQFSDDESILSYREITPQNTGNAPSYLAPLGRWCSKEDALRGYSRIRKALINFVANNDNNLRNYYTKSGRGPTAYRDLHQLLLISVAHTERHLKQIKSIMDRTES
ncbi:MAG: DinB family protein [Cyclobacteriaceae bacterium]